MSIMLIVDAKIKEDKISEYADFFAEILPDTRNFEGNEGISLCVDEEDPSRIFLVEKWAAKENYEKYHHWREERGDLEKIRSFLDGRPNRIFLDIVNV